jgi:hypothetical protein
MAQSFWKSSAGTRLGVIPFITWMRAFFMVILREIDTQSLVSQEARMLAQFYFAVIISVGVVHSTMITRVQYGDNLTFYATFAPRVGCVNERSTLTEKIPINVPCVPFQLLILTLVCNCTNCTNCTITQKITLKLVKVQNFRTFGWIWNWMASRKNKRECMGLEDGVPQNHTFLLFLHFF